MAFRLKLVPEHTAIDFFRAQKITFGISTLLAILSVVVLFMNGLNFGIDFRGGTTIRTESAQPVDVGAYRAALAPLDLGDVAITEVFDPGFRADQNVAQVRISAQDGVEAVTPETIQAVEAALQTVDPSITFPSVESVGPKVSAELIQTAIYAVLASLVAISIYIWLRFEWQFAVGAIVSLIHDVLITMGIFALFQIRFDLTTIAALLTIVGYSINDKIVIDDRIRENLRKYRQMDFRELIDLSVNETLPRTVMTSVTLILALGALLIFGGDVIRGFTAAMLLGIIVGTYSSIYVSSSLLISLGVGTDSFNKKAMGAAAGAERVGPLRD